MTGQGKLDILDFWKELRMPKPPSQADQVLHTAHFDPSEALLPADAAPPAWEEVAAGRYQPRRIRGSYLGRALG